MEHKIHPVHGVPQGGGITDVSDVELDLMSHVGHLDPKLVAHIVLQGLVTGENTDLPHVGGQKAAEQGMTEGARTAGDEQGLICKQSHNASPTNFQQKIDFSRIFFIIASL